MARRSWTTADADRIREMAAQRIGWDKIGAAFGVSSTAARNFGASNGIKLPPKPVWSDVDTDRLRVACQQGGTWGDVARACKISEFTALEKAKLYGIAKARAINDEIKIKLCGDCKHWAPEAKRVPLGIHGFMARFGECGKNGDRVDRCGICKEGDK